MTDCQERVQARLPYPIGLYGDRAGGRTAWAWFAYRLPTDLNEQQLASAHAAQSAICAREVVPMQLNAEHNRKLRALCDNPAISVDANVVDFLLSDVIGIASSADHAQRRAKKQAHIRDLVYDPEYAASMSDYIHAGLKAVDLRFLNGRSADPAFELFLQFLHKRLEARSQLAPDERRQPDASGAAAQLGATATVHRTPLAPSLPVLHALVKADMEADPAAKAKLDSGEAKIPSLSALAARMSPSHPARNTSLRYTGIAGIRWCIQRRTARKAHGDAHYVNAQAKLTREALVAMQQVGVKTLFLSDDDKCKIAVGQPGLAQTAATRSRRVIAGRVSRQLQCGCGFMCLKQFCMPARVEVSA